MPKTRFVHSGLISLATTSKIGNGKDEGMRHVGRSLHFWVRANIQYRANDWRSIKCLDAFLPLVGSHAESSFGLVNIELDKACRLS